MAEQGFLFGGVDAYGEVIFPKAAHHDGKTYDETLDRARLNAQTQRVFDAIKDGEWRTLGEIAAVTGDPEASVSARLRDLRKVRFGGFQIGRRRRGKPSAGLWEYRLGS